MLLHPWRESAGDALALGQRPVELAGLRLSPSEQKICKEVTRELKERRVVGIRPYARPPPKHELRFSLPAFEQRKAWASRHMLLPRLGGAASHLRYLRQATALKHPLGAQPMALPSDLRAAIAYVSGKAGGVVADRVARRAGSYRGVGSRLNCVVACCCAWLYMAGYGCIFVYMAVWLYLVVCG